MRHPLFGPDGREPLRFDFRALLEKAKKLPLAVDGVSLSLPFLGVTFKPNNVEKKAAREIVIRLADKRVLNAFECCDDCIKKALASLQEIRRILVDKQVELSDRTDSALYLLIELMLESIRQFLTFTERREPRMYRDEYFAALRRLRPHLYRCLAQIARIADIQIPKIADNMRYDDAWDQTAYLPPDSKPMPKGQPSKGTTKRLAKRESR